MRKTTTYISISLVTITVTLENGGIAAIKHGTVKVRVPKAQSGGKEQLKVGNVFVIPRVGFEWFHLLSQKCQR